MIPEDAPGTVPERALRRVKDAEKAAAIAHAEWALAQSKVDLERAELDVLHARNRVETLRRDGAS